MSSGPEFPQSDGPAPDPLELARAWFPSDEEPDRPQIVLSTIGRDGFPNSRTVLLSEVSPHGYLFHCDSRSRKAAEIEGDNRVSILAVWPNFTRQLAIQGLAVAIDPMDAAKAYARRSPYLKQLAWQNTAEYATLPLEERETIWGQFLIEHPDGEFETPESWLGILVKPTRFTFWASNPAAASRRGEYVATPSGWEFGYLPG
jgi:pyridoxamine 5'-phosphate oxidase